GSSSLSTPCRRLPRGGSNKGGIRARQLRKAEPREGQGAEGRSAGRAADRAQSTAERAPPRDRAWSGGDQRGPGLTASGNDRHRCRVVRDGQQVGYAG